MSTQKPNISQRFYAWFAQHRRACHYLSIAAIYALFFLLLSENLHGPFGGHFQQLTFPRVQNVSVETIDRFEDEAETVSVSLRPITQPILQPVTSFSSSSLRPAAPAIAPQSSSVSSALLNNNFVQKNPVPVQTSSFSSVSIGLPPADGFPAFGNAVHPVQEVPNWGAMTTAQEWDRNYSQLSESDFVAIPRYDLSVLTTPLTTLMADRWNNVPAITAKLYYSTRYFGQYNLDSGEFSGAHDGVDLKMVQGTPVGTVAGGRVHAVITDARLGLHVIVEHRHPTAGTFFSIYGHLSGASVKVNQDLAAGQTIGTVGMSGKTTAPHLHLQIDRDTGARPHVPFYTAEGISKDQAERYSVSPIWFIGEY